MSYALGNVCGSCGAHGDQLGGYRNSPDAGKWTLRGNKYDRWKRYCEKKKKVNRTWQVGKGKCQMLGKEEMCTQNSSPERLWESCILDCRRPKEIDAKEREQALPEKGAVPRSEASDVRSSTWKQCYWYRPLSFPSPWPGEMFLNVISYFDVISYFGESYSPGFPWYLHHAHCHQTCGGQVGTPRSKPEGLLPVALMGHISGARVIPGDQHRPTSQQHCILVMDCGSWLEQRPFARAV